MDAERLAADGAPATGAVPPSPRAIGVAIVASLLFAVAAHQAAAPSRPDAATAGYLEPATGTCGGAAATPPDYMGHWLRP